MNRNKIVLIAIKGGKYCGKDTIAEFLIKKYGFERYAFADPIKKAAMEMFGFTEAQMWGSTEDKETVDERWGISPRRMLQLMGTELFQFDIHKHLNPGEFNVGRSVWVQRFKYWFQDELKKRIVENRDLKIVISDLRFKHEAEIILSMGGEIWEVERPSIKKEDLHASETEMKSIIPNEHFINDGTVEDLYSKISDYFKNDLELHHDS